MVTALGALYFPLETKMSDKLFNLIQEFASLIDSLLTDITLNENEQIEHRRLIHRLESFALSVKGETTLEESPVNQARSLFVQIYRMQLSRGSREVFFEKAEAIEREASNIPYVASLYLNDEELRAIADVVDMETFDHHGLTDTETPLGRACKKLNHLVIKRTYS